MRPSPIVASRRFICRMPTNGALCSYLNWD
nr:MAG TPA: hypothetical protein [Caudoviricetes sp.]